MPNIFIYNLVSFSPLVCLEVNLTNSSLISDTTKSLLLTNHILQKLAGLWVANSPEKERELFYNQLSHITFMCPMRFNKFPFDRCQHLGCFPKPFFWPKRFPVKNPLFSHICPLKVGSTSHDNTRMTFGLR